MPADEATEEARADPSRHFAAGSGRRQVEPSETAQARPADTAPATVFDVGDGLGRGGAGDQTPAPRCPSDCC